MNQFKKLAVVMPNMAAGGSERVVLNLLKEILKKDLKIEIDLVLGAVEGSWINKIPSEVRVIDLKTPIGPTFKKISRVTFPLCGYLRKEKPDLVLSNYWYYNVFVVLAVALSRINTYLVIVEHGSFSVIKNKGTIPWLIPLLMRCLYPQANSIVTVSKGLAQELEDDLKLKPGLITTIYNPIIEERLSQISKESVTHPWFQDGEIPVILGVGRLCNVKDFPTLIRAFALVRKKLPARLVILGDGEDKPRLMDLVRELGLEDNVALLGFVEDPYSYMARSSVFVLSSIVEGLGNVLIEAMALGTPLVSTNCPSGPAEILDNGKYGELVPVGDNKAMADGILRVLSGDIKSVDSGWLKQFTVEAATQNYLNILGINKYD
ncbi:glycosyltransferase [Limnofasciculus baicalensis]|uniref:Glycosyltransferase n=1 Tax=Limnofasciculus baicalensis BBK-W-15 TaxID=2699891 RepID=A0AAE3GNL0_9CYAN|nr:glycosyltransferase [Limnofasciculus baicalensis]MCP2727684.1 glycosyltransferase [Limnofasciculus baicalensis BBK-W-15]